jgi:TonB C terminal
MTRDRDYAAARAHAARQIRFATPASSTLGTIEVSEFSPRQRSSLIESRVFVSAGCAAVSALLHLALLTSTIWPGSREQPNTHQPDGGATSREPAAIDPALEWVAVDEHSAAVSSLLAAPLVPPPVLTPVAVAVPLPEIAAHFPDVEPGDAQPGAKEESDSRARSFGQYLGQINARIDRAWTRPRTPIGATRFLCEVRVEQDSLGNVREVALEHCNGTPAWQRSLVDAIKFASPLPAPADPDAFAPQVRMVFREDARDEAATADPLRSASSVNPSINSASDSFDRLRQLRNRSAHPGEATVIDLRIEGRLADQRGQLPARAASQPPEQLITGPNALPVDAGGTPHQQQYH